MSILGSTGSSSSSAAASSSSSALPTSAASVQSEYQTFLTLLTTELQNQDPTQPLDSSQFTSQLAQFSSLEQQLQSNQYLQALVTNQSSTGVAQSLGYVGSTVEAAGDSFAVSSNNSTNTPLNYSLTSAATSATIDIVNSSGQTVNAINVTNPTSGMNNYSFDNTDANGNALPAGTYTYSVSAQDANGTPITTTPYETGTVTGVGTSSGSTILDLSNGLTVPASGVIQATSNNAT